MNTFMNGLQNATNFKHTENGAVAHKSTMMMVYDMFAFGGAYRKRSLEDCVLLFKNAYEENPELALKCLFYLGDCRGGQGERRFFRICFKWLCGAYPEAARRNLQYIPEFRRWDDVLYATEGTMVFMDALELVKTQLALDVECKTPSLLAKWLPSENASAKDTVRMGNIVRRHLGMTHKQYRRTLSILRERIKVVEKLMSANRWDEIEFDKIPSKAGLVYKNAFARRDMIAKKYETFIKSKDTKVNAKALFPYEVTRDALKVAHKKIGDVDREAVNKYWDNLPNYFGDEECSLMAVVDTSASMWGEPINVAISLGLICAEQLRGPFAGHFISFSRQPKLIKTEGVDFVDKVKRIHDQNLCENTNLTGVFDMLKEIALQPGVNKEDVPKTIVVISDMEIDTGSSCHDYWYRRDNVQFKGWTTENAATEMEKVRLDWKAAGLAMPRLVYWNVDARSNTVLDLSENVSLVSGCSPIIFQQVVKGVTGIQLMLDKLNSDRYTVIG